MELYWLNKDNILHQIGTEYDYWYNHIEAKRQRRRDDLKLYVKESQDDVVDVHSIYTTIQTLMAINYLNEIAVEFTKRKPWDEERATNANIVAKYDYNEMNLSVKDYIWEINRLLYWCWIQTAWDFDFTSIHPTIYNVDTLAYIFDPKGWPTIEDHRFFWIETEMTMEEMKNAWYEDYEDLWNITWTLELNSNALDIARWQGWQDDFTDNRKYQVYIAWTIFKGEKYIAVTSKDFQKLLKFTKLIPVFEEEKKDPSKIMFPIALKYFSYLPWDSMWISPFDLLRSKQSAYSVLFNLMLKMAYKNAMWWDRLVNTRKIKDLSWLSTPTLDWKDIPVNLEKWESLNDVITYTQKDTPTQLPQELRVWLQEETILDTWIDRNTQWVLAQWSNTLWEREMAQKNANLRFLLWSKQAMWGEMFRWKYLWYRQYSANLKSVDKKEFILETWYTEDFHAFTKDDFVWSDLLNLKIQSKAEVEQERMQMKSDRMASYPQQIQEAMMEWQKRKILILQRNRMRDIWEAEDRIMQIYPYSIDELRARDKFKILKLAIWIKDKAKQEMVAKEWLRINSLDEEHNVYIELFQTLPESEIKRKAIQMRYDIIKEKEQLMAQEQALTWQVPQEQMQTWANMSAWNVATAQATANQMQWITNTPSLVDIAG